MKNVDVYVTGSNAKFLSKDIITEFRGRGDEIHMFPLNFREFMSAYPGDKESGWKEYVLYGSIPLILEFNAPDQKVDFLKNLFDETYISDIVGRNNVRNKSALAISDEVKKEQEQRSLLLTQDGFKKIIITKDALAPLYNEDGVLVMGLFDFLLDEGSLEL